MISIIIFSFIIAVAVALLIWSLVEIGSKAGKQYKERFQDQSQANLHDLFFTVDPTRLFIANISALVLGCVIAWLMTGSFIVVAVTAVVFFMLPRWVYAWLRKRRIEKIEEQLPDTILMIAGGARAGQSLVLAMRQVGGELEPPIAQEFDVMQREQRLGVSLDDSLENLARRVPVSSVALMVSAMRIANETGGGLAETLERTAETLRAQHAMELKIKALTAQGKLQAWVVGMLPVAFIYILHKLEPVAMEHLWTTPTGWAVLAMISFMEFFGVLLIRRIVSIDV